VLFRSVGVDDDRPKSLIFGRHPNGDPLACDPAKEACCFEGLNDFTFLDADGINTPQQSHIRKVNPRGWANKKRVEIGGPESSFRIARRGITYDESTQESKNLGLLFMCYQANLNLQFVKLQGWSNNPKFVNAAPFIVPKDVPHPGIDPVIGRTAFEKHKTQLWPGIPQEKICKWPVSDFVTLQGGEFFFTPSISGLGNLATN